MGSTLPEIAWQKTGIMKKNSLFLAISQPEQVLEVIKKQSVEKKVNFYLLTILLKCLLFINR